MSTRLVAKYGVVFGHYDSRGGTAFIEIAEPTVEQVQKACTYYDKEFFAYDEETDRAQNAGVGRECDILADQLVRGGERPSSEDFMYVARLWYAEGTWTRSDETNDLEELGAVLEAVNGGRNGEKQLHPAWTGGPDPGYVSFMDVDRPAYGSDEYMKANEPHFEWQQRWETWLRIPPYPVFELEFVRHRINPDESEDEELQAVRSAALTDFGKEVTEIPRWDDDAYGFIVIRMA